MENFFAYFFSIFFPLSALYLSESVLLLHAKSVCSEAKKIAAAHALHTVRFFEQQSFNLVSYLFINIKSLNDYKKNMILFPIVILKFS
jgi:hypothetical protein